jgi:hypothetical protein
MLKLTKKQRILDMFNSQEWFKSSGGNMVKTFTGDHFWSYDLAPWIEDCESYNDVIYARRIIQGLGHKVLIGLAFHVYKDKLKTNKQNG